MFASDPAPVSRSGTVLRARTHLPDDPLLGAIGHTPLLPLRHLLGREAAGFELWAKAEFMNPSGSVKDRAAWGIVRSALADGSLGPGRTLLDASSGNTGVAYAMLGARVGFPVELCLPRHVAPDRLERILSYGARVVFTNPAEGTDGAQAEARRRAEAEPERYFYPDQYNHAANPDAHYRTTGPEIWAQSEGRVTDLVAGVGTGGTISGTARFLRERRPDLRVTAVEPDGPLHGLEGLKHLPTARRPGTYDATLVDATLRVETEAALAMRGRLAREEGLFVGASAGAAVVAALEVGRRHPGSVVVTVLPDAGRPRSEPEGR